MENLPAGLYFFSVIIYFPGSPTQTVGDGLHRIEKPTDWNEVRDQVAVAALTSARGPDAQLPEEAVVHIVALERLGD